MSFSNRMNRITKLMADIDSAKCPRCFGTNGKAACARVFITGWDGVRRLNESGMSPIFDGHGRCLACGAIANEINLVVVGAG